MGAGEQTSKKRSEIGPVMAGAIALFLLLLGGYGVLRLSPKAPPSPDLLIENDQIQLHQSADKNGTMKIDVINNGQKIASLGEGEAYSQITVTSRPMDINADGIKDLMVYGWTGGMNCCITHFVVDGANGTTLAKVPQGGGEPGQFLILSTENGPQALLVMKVRLGSEQDGDLASPQGVIVLRWDGPQKRFVLARELMGASASDGMPAMWAQRSNLVDALTAFATSESYQPKFGLFGRGEAMGAYSDWLAVLHGQMMMANLADDPISGFAPIRAFLDEQTFKGHFSDGMAAIYGSIGVETDRNLLNQALADYRARILASPWGQTLDQFNGGEIAKPKIITPPPLVTPVPVASENSQRQ